MEEDDDISLTDLVRKIDNGPALIEKWLRNKNTIEFLGIWEEMYNADFNTAQYMDNGIHHSSDITGAQPFSFDRNIANLSCTKGEKLDELLRAIGQKEKKSLKVEVVKSQGVDTPLGVGIIRKRY